MSKVWRVICDLVCAISHKCAVRPLPPPEEDEYLFWLKAQKQASEDAMMEHRRRRRSIDDTWKRSTRDE